jgi:hypothetical protein
MNKHKHNNLVKLNKWIDEKYQQDSRALHGNTSRQGGNGKGDRPMASSKGL